MQYQHLSISRDGAVATITLDRPPVNAISSQVLAELHHAARDLNNDGTTKAVLLIGGGKHFAAGADIKEISGLAPGEAVDEFSSKGQEAFLEIERASIPYIALVRGFCLGGGCELAMACHMRIADRSAVFGQPEIKLGICPGFGASQRLPRIIGRSRAAYMLLTGEQIDAQRAHEWGLATLMVPEGETLEQAGARIARSIAGFSRTTITALFELANFQNDHGFEQGLERESELFGELSATEDMREGFRAFIEKRPPVFQDR
jgi:enoyl-CoA hydratase